MRLINKQPEIESFSNFKVANPTAVWNDFSRPGGPGHAAYIETRLQLLVTEQNCICGYTEIPLEDERDSHIDHYRKRSMFANQTFNWSNLIAACNDEDFGAKYKDNKSGITIMDYGLIFNPAIDQVHDYFYYNERGEIEPASNLDPALKAKVLKTIEVFNLSDKSLVNRRKTAIEQVKNCVGLTPDEIFSAMQYGGFISLLHQYAAQ